MYYEVGDIVTITGHGGAPVRVAVAAKVDHLLDGMPGFIGLVRPASGRATERRIWGLTTEITAVEPYDASRERE